MLGSSDLCFEVAIKLKGRHCIVGYSIIDPDCRLLVKKSGRYFEFKIMTKQFPGYPTSLMKGQLVRPKLAKGNALCPLINHSKFI